jgi:hypothetical protein
MISRIIAAITRRIDAHTARENEFLTAARQFAIELHLAMSLHDGKPEVMAIIAQICGDALEASDRNDLQGMKNATAAIREWVG